MTPARHRAAFAASFVALAAVDLATKRWAVTALHDPRRELPGPVDLQLSYNEGTAFGLFATVPANVIAIASIAFVAIVLNMWRARRAPSVPAALVVAGSLANVVDRLEGGSVIDMLHTGWWPTFNLADILIVTGVSWWIATSITSPDTTQAGLTNTADATTT